MDVIYLFFIVSFFSALPFDFIQLWIGKYCVCCTHDVDGNILKMYGEMDRSGLNPECKHNRIIQLLFPTLFR